ncbi:hypothetical protein GGF50DRAFT_110979 [Schizophyllum commune]
MPRAAPNRQQVRPSSVRTLVQTLKRYPDNPSPSTVRLVCSQIIPLVSSESAFQGLLKDPLLLPQNEWTMSSHTVAQAISHLLEIQDLLGVKKPWDSHLHDPILKILERIWFSLVAWIDFLHPSSDYVEPTSDLIGIIIGILWQVMKRKKALAHLLALTPRLYAHTMWLWLHNPSFIHDHVARRITDNVILFARITSAVMDLNSIVHNDAEGTTWDGAATSEALVAIEYRPRRLYSLGVRCALTLFETIRFLNEEYVENALLTLEQHLKLLHDFARDILPIDDHQKEVVYNLVDLARAIQGFNPGDDAAVEVFVLLCDIWQTAKDNRSLIWALNRDAFPLMAAISRSTADYSQYTFDDIPPHVAARTAFAPVLRAFERHRGGASFASMARLYDRKEMKAIESTVRDRTIVHENVPWVVKKCTKCERKDAILRQCKCKTVRYCSEACQIEEWPRHRIWCVGCVRRGFTHDAAFEILQDAPYMTHRTFTFVVFLVREFVVNERNLILPEVKNMHANRPAHGSKKNIIHLEIDFGEAPSTWKVQYVDESSRFEPIENWPTVVVTAKLYPLPTGSEPPCVAAWRCTLAWFEANIDYHRGYRRQPVD